MYGDNVIGELGEEEEEEEEEWEGRSDTKRLSLPH
jgi:hypothetical protein